MNAKQDEKAYKKNLSEIREKLRPQKKQKRVENKLVNNNAKNKKSSDSILKKRKAPKAQID